MNPGIGLKRRDMLVAEFVVGTVNERDYQLDCALAAAESKAHLERRLGVLITRHDFHRFSVWLTADVPYGTTEERDYARRR